MDPGTILATVELSAKVLLVIYEYLKDVKEAKEGIKRLQSEVEGVHNIFSKLLDFVNGPNAAKVPTSFKKLEFGRRGKAMHKLGLRSLVWPLNKKELGSHVKSLEKYKTSASLCLSIDQSSRLSAVQIDQQLAKLRYADGASFDSSYREHEPRCLIGTRVKILDQIEERTAQGDKQIFWLSGVAGAGKSTIGRTVAASCASKGLLAGSFFFSRGHGSLGQVGQFVTTLVRQLSTLQPWLRPHIAKAIMDKEDLLFGSLQQQWGGLVIAMLQEAAKSSPSTEPSKLIFEVDALDECDRQNDIRLILQLFRDLQDIPKLKTRVLLTSRREIPIRLGFSKLPDILHYDLDLGDVPRDIVEHDVLIYLETELGRIAEERHLTNWPTPQSITRLVSKSDLLFIYTATVCRFIDDLADLPTERFSLVLDDSSTSTIELPAIDQMYTTVLEHSIEKGLRGVALQRLTQRFQLVIGSFVNLMDVLPASSLAGLPDIPLEQVEVAFRPLHSLVYVPSNSHDSILSIHPSFREFLLDSHRCVSSHFRVSPQQAHLHLFHNCLAVPSRFLVQDICKVKDLGIAVRDVPIDLVDAHLPQHVRYACLHWVAHLGESLQTSETDLCEFLEQALDQFFNKSVLSWFEALSLTGRISDSIPMIT